MYPRMKTNTINNNKIENYKKSNQMREKKRKNTDQTIKHENVSDNENKHQKQ